VYQSEGHSSFPAELEPVEISLGNLCRGDYSRPIKIELIQSKNNQSEVIYGEIITNINKLLEKKTE